jgi:predicted dehydrogenase
LHELTLLITGLRLYKDVPMQQIGVAIIGTGQIALANHLPGLALHPAAKVVALCDSNPATLEAASHQTGVQATFTDYKQAIAHPEVNAVIVATPNFLHPQILRDAVASKRHVLCEKPLALNYPDAYAMYRAAVDAGVRHMTAFTYRFVPAMRYLKHLCDRGDFGQIYHFRAQRFQDWGDRELGWRQVKALCGTGELGDMLSHRIDYAHYLIGPITRIAADMRNFVPVRGRAGSDVDDSVSILADFQSGTTGVLESTKLATGVGEGHGGEDVVQINGAEGSAAYSTQNPLQIRIARRGDKGLKLIDIPREFLVYPGSPRDPTQGDPLATFRYDQDFAFVDAIVHDHPCSPDLLDGANVQRVMDAAVLASEERRWVSIDEIEP